MAKFNEVYSDKSYIPNEGKLRDLVCKEENQKKAKNQKIVPEYRIQNKSGKYLMKYRIDNGISNSTDFKKCDWGVYLKDDDILYLVELKGADLEEPILQLISTIDNIINKAGVKVSQINARAVLTKVRAPNIRDTDTKAIKRKLKSFGNGTFDFDAQKYIETI